MAAPAVRVGVLIGEVTEHEASLLEVSDEGLVGLLEEHPADDRHLVAEVSIGLKGIDDGKSVAAAGEEVIRTEGGSLMHEAGAIVGGHVVGEEHEVGIGDVDEVEGPVVANPLERGPGHRLEDSDLILTEDRWNELLRHDEQLVLLGAHHGVGGIRLHRDGGVRHECPRSRGPDEKRDTRVALGEGVIRAHGESDIDRRIDDRLVALCQLVVGQAGAAPGAVGRHAMILGEQPLVEDLLERPPDALDVVLVHGPVGAIHVDPVAHAPGHLGELVHMPQDGLATAGIELRDAVGLDVLLSREAELLLHGQLDGQAVTVPAGLSRNVVALHRPVAGEDVLEDASLDVMGARCSVRRGRPLVEHPEGSSLALGDRGLEDALGVPHGQDLVLQCRQVDLRWHGPVHGASWGQAGHCRRA